MTQTFDAAGSRLQDGDGADDAHFRVVIIGGGIGGLGLAIRLKEAGIDDYVVLERSSAPGGTWQANTYPGCECDVQSHLYSFSFAPNPDWSQVYASQREIWSYLRQCAERFGVDDHFRLNTEVTGAAWDEDAQVWRIETNAGSFSAEFLIPATGGMSEPLIPRIAGLEDFGGDVFHTAAWNHDVDLTGKRVAVVGSGASAVQVVPEVQKIAERVIVFQRTPGWVYPKSNRTITKTERRLYRRFPLLQRVVRTTIYWSREMLVPPSIWWPRLSWFPELGARLYMRRQVPDLELRARLTPDYRLGCKRILLSKSWYPALQQPNVDLVFGGLEEVRPNGVVTPEGLQEVDAIIFATGFHITDPPFAEVLKGVGGVTLADTWNGSPRAYRGAAFAGFPNLLWLGGPNTGHGHTSFLFMLEALMDYMLEALREIDEGDIGRIEVRAEAQRAYNDRLQRRLPRTVWNSGGCSTWHFDANGDNSVIWPFVTWRFRWETRRFDIANYETTARARADATAAQVAP